MTAAAFIASIESELREADDRTFAPDAILRQLPNWSSMLALLLIARIDEVYGVQISASDFSRMTTINDLHQWVQSHQVA